MNAPGSLGNAVTDELVELVRTYKPHADADRLRRAYEFAKRSHRGQFRKSGEPYLTHPLAVARWLAERRIDDTVVVAALLHDTLEDSGRTRDDIATEFGEEIAFLVDGVTNLKSRLDTDRLAISDTVGASEVARQTENFRRLFVNVAKDGRVLLVKLADRLHNMQTIQFLEREKRIKKARETLDIFAPLAGRMGAQTLREELEDCAFRILDPDRRLSIIRRYLTLKQKTSTPGPDAESDPNNGLREDGGGSAEHVTDAFGERVSGEIETALKDAGIPCSVDSRKKTPFSIWRKMQLTGAGFDSIFDVYGFRIIVDDVPEVYQALGVVHRKWAAIPGRFKDYISQPKSNGYRSVHTSVYTASKTKETNRIEVQIRTRKMHEVAETGIAAHWSYRDGVRVENPYVPKENNWLLEMCRETTSSDDYEEFAENVKLEMYSETVFCFTPTGEVVRLPTGATPVDFAYAVHTDLGHECVGAKIDGKRKPLATNLRNGQMVEILRQSGSKPAGEWLNHARTRRAKYAINKALKDQVRERRIAFGRKMMDTLYLRYGFELSENDLRLAARKMGVPGTDDLLAAVGAEEMSADEVASCLYPERIGDTSNGTGPPRRMILLPDNCSLAEDVEPTMAHCCSPLPGEAITGVSVDGAGIVVHALDCLDLQRVENDQRIELTWSDGPYAPIRKAMFRIQLVNHKGALGRICNIIGNQDANISDMSFVDKNRDFYVIIVEVEVRDLDHFRSVISAVGQDGSIAEVERCHSLGASPA